MSQPAITFVTGNPNKLRELQQLAPDSMEFTSHAMDLDEVQSLDLRTIVEHKLRQAFEELGSPVIVEDVAAGLDSLNGLPGPFVKFFNQELGHGALYTLSKVENDKVTITCLAGYFDGEQMIFGEGITTGHITAPRGENGFGFDSVVVPDEQPDPAHPDRTMAEMTPQEKNAISHRAKAQKALISSLG